MTSEKCAVCGKEGKKLCNECEVNFGIDIKPEKPNTPKNIAILYRRIRKLENENKDLKMHLRMMIKRGFGLSRNIRSYCIEKRDRIKD